MSGEPSLELAPARSHSAAHRTREREPADQAPQRAPKRVALLLSDLNGGGVQRMSLVVAEELARRGHRVDLVVCEPDGELEEAVPRNLRRVTLRPASGLAGRLAALRADPAGLAILARPLLLPRRVSPTLPYLPDLASYLRRERPDALIAATPNHNVEAVLARRLARVTTRLILTERTALAEKLATSPRWRHRYLPPLLRRTYLEAEAIVAVSEALADDLAAATGIPRARIRTIYNPLVSAAVRARADEPLDHPWFRPGEPPVVLSAGRLTDVKDFPTLIEAFARLRAQRPARLVILGRAKDERKTAERRAEFAGLAERLGVGADVELPGYVHNPFRYMRRAAVFALTSRREGLPGVLVQAMACGCPVVSTDCPTGPREVLAEGRFGRLVPVGDAAALAQALAATLDDPPPAELLEARAAEFSVERAIDRYEALLG